MFEVLKLLRELKVLRPSLRWEIGGGGYDDGYLVVRIPVTDEDVKFTRDMQAMFAPKEEEDTA